MTMKKKLLSILFLTGAGVGATTLALTEATGLSSVFAQYSPATAGTWVHYSQALPGEAAGAYANFGVREYWVECGGAYQFTAPSVDPSNIKEGGTNYDFAEFGNWDPRYIVPINAHTNAFDSVLYDTTNGSASFGEVYNMKSAGSFTAAAGTAFPGVGETKKVLWLRDNPTGPSFYADTLGATRVFKNSGEYYSVFIANKTYEADEYLDGLYVFGADVTLGTNFNGATDLWTERTDRGFRGTLDGRGHTITCPESYNGGMFSMLLGATIKNINYASVKLPSSSSAYAIFACQAHDCIFSNLSFEITQDAYATDDFRYGTLISRYTYNNLFENIKIAYQSGITVHKAVLGYGPSNFTNVFDNVIVQADNATHVLGTAQTSYADGLKGYQSVLNSAVLIDAARQDVHVNSAGTIALTTGETNVGTISSISVVSYKGNSFDLGSDLSDLVIPAELKNTPADHGQAMVTITNTSDESFCLPVTLVTEYLATKNDLALIRGANLGTKVFGYFALTADIIVDYSDGGIGADVQPAYTLNGNENGFYGDLDGRGHRIAGNISTAKFGVVPGLRGNGEIKNLVVNNTGMTGYGEYPALTYRPFGSSATSTVKMYNLSVTANLQGSNGTNYKGILCANLCKNAVLQNIKVSTLKENATADNVANAVVYLMPLTANILVLRYNHIVWDTVTAKTNQFIEDSATIPAGVTINLH